MKTANHLEMKLIYNLNVGLCDGGGGEKIR